MEIMSIINSAGYIKVALVTQNFLSIKLAMSVLVLKNNRFFHILLIILKAVSTLGFYFSFIFHLHYFIICNWIT